MGFSEKQLQIISTAEKLFASKGFDGTSVRDIAEGAGVNLAMISYYFGSKEGLMQALFKERTENVRLKVETLLNDETLSPLQKINSLADDYIQKILHKQQFHKIMVYEQMLQKNPEITAMISELKKENATQITRLLKDGQKRGAFKKDIDVVLLMNIMIGAITQTFSNQAYYREFYQLQHLPDDQFREKLKKRLTNYIKNIFKAILSNEA